MDLVHIHSTPDNVNPKIASAALTTAQTQAGLGEGDPDDNSKLPSPLLLAEIAGLPAWLAEHFKKRAANRQLELERKRRESYSGEWDQDSDRALAAYLIERDLEEHGSPAEGHGSDARTYTFAARLLDLPLAEETVAGLLHEHWAPHFDPDWLLGKVRNALDYRTSEQGCEHWEQASEIRKQWIEDHPEQAAAARATMAELDNDARIDAKFMRSENTGAPLVKSRSLADYVYSPTTAPARRDLIPDWFGSGGLLTIGAPGGYHKSRLILQLFISKLYDRPLFRQVMTEPVARSYTIGARGCGGIPVSRYEALFYEDDDEEMHRRIEMLRKARLKVLPVRGGADDPTWRCTFHQPSMPVLRVDDKGEIKLTALGYKMLRRWEDLAGAGHLLLWFDSFFDAIDMAEGARNDDAIARRVIGILNHWCKVLDATIITPLHPSRSGQRDQHSGYAPAFDNSPRLGGRITAITEQVKDGERNERKQSGNFAYTITKWNGGPQGKRIVFWFENGELVSGTDMYETDTAAFRAAVDIVLSFTYGQDGLQRLRAALNDTERENVERQHLNRIRRTRNSDKWEVVQGGKPTELTTKHFIIQSFRDRTGNPNATVAQFIAACEQSVQMGRLGNREVDRNATSSKRLPAGFYALGRGAETIETLRE